MADQGMITLDGTNQTVTISGPTRVTMVGIRPGSGTTDAKVKFPEIGGEDDPGAAGVPSLPSEELMPFRQPNGITTFVVRGTAGGTVSWWVLEGALAS